MPIRCSQLAIESKRAKACRVQLQHNHRRYEQWRDSVPYKNSPVSIRKNLLHHMVSYIVLYTH